MFEPTEKQLKPTLLSCALLLLEDGCPPEKGFRLCEMQEDEDGCSCRLCWSTYLYYVANGRKQQPYFWERIHEGGMLGA